jgi:hypothetical protein
LGLLFGLLQTQDLSAGFFAGSGCWVTFFITEPTREKLLAKFLLKKKFTSIAFENISANIILYISTQPTAFSAIFIADGFTKLWAFVAVSTSGPTSID